MASIGSDITNMMKSRNTQQQPAAAPQPPAAPAPAPPQASPQPGVSQQQVIKGIKSKRMKQGGQG